MRPAPRPAGAGPLRAPPVATPWPDLLHRRIAMQARRLGGLSLAPDGRIAISAGTRVSVLHAVSATAPSLASGATPVDALRAVLDASAREARTMRPPLIGHALVYDAVSPALSVSALAWAPPPDVSVLLIASPLRRIAPVIHADFVAEFSAVRLWRTLRMRDDESAGKVELADCSPGSLGEKNKLQQSAQSSSKKVKHELPEIDGSLKIEQIESAHSANMEPSVQLKLQLRPLSAKREEATLSLNAIPNHGKSRSVKRKRTARRILRVKDEEQIAPVKNASQKSVQKHQALPRRTSRRARKVKRLIDFDDWDSSEDEVKPPAAQKGKKRSKHPKEDSDYEPTQDGLELVPALRGRPSAIRSGTGVSRLRIDGDSEVAQAPGEEDSVKRSRKRTGKKSGSKRKQKDNDSDFAVTSDDEFKEDTDESEEPHESRQVPSPFGRAQKSSRSSTLSKSSAQPVKPPSDPILCTAFVFVCATDVDGTAILDDDFVVKGANFLLLGTKNGVFIQRWHGPCAALGQKRQLSEDWASSVGVASCIDVANSPSSKVAIGGPYGRVLVLGLTWNPGDNDGDELNIVVLWKAPSGIFHGPVSSLCFGQYMRNAHYVYLAIAAGNCVAAVRTIDLAPGTELAGKPRKTQVCLQGNAHYEVVSSVAWLPDGTVFSASADGSMFRWRLQWEADKKPCTLISVLQYESADLTSVMAAKRSENGVLVVALSSRPKTMGEIGEPAVHVKRKYGSGARSSLLSILAYPDDHENDDLRTCVEAAVTRLMDCSKHAIAPVSMWDIQLWIISDQRRLCAAATVLREQFDMLMSFVEAEGVPAVANRVRKVAYCVAGVLEKAIENSPLEVSKLRNIQKNLRIALLARSYLDILERFVGIPESKLTEKVSPEEREALEAMCSFVSLNCSVFDEQFGLEFTLDEARRKLANFFPSPVTRALSICPICDPSLELPLVADVDQPEAFFCASGDYFPRCVRTALPCTDAVPLVCTGCQSRARCKGIDHYFDFGADFESWNKNGAVCPLCNCPLLPSTMETF